jgi:hypothetical protein
MGILTAVPVKEMSGTARCRLQLDIVSHWPKTTSKQVAVTENNLWFFPDNKFLYL